MMLRAALTIMCRPPDADDKGAIRDGKAPLVAHLEQRVAEHNASRPVDPGSVDDGDGF